MSRNKDRNKPHQGRQPDQQPTRSGSVIIAASVVAKTAQTSIVSLTPSSEGEASAVQTETVASPLPASTTLQQQRAAFALARIRALADEWANEVKKQKEFNRYASAMPFMIHANGLGQTAAFYRRKGPDHTYYRLYQLLGDWLGQPGQPFAGQPDLLDGVTRSDLDAYLAAQAEALLFLDWVKKLASAFLARDEETDP
jgi:CRISPR-associated protein Cmr5